MSASKNSSPLGGEDWIDGHGNPVAKGKLPGANCPCGWSGKVFELLADDDSDNTTLYCPQCETSGWLFT
jgi:hypothetical protein